MDEMEMRDRLEEVILERIKAEQEMGLLMDESPPRKNRDALLKEIETRLALLNDEYRRLKGE